MSLQLSQKAIQNHVAGMQTRKGLRAKQIPGKMSQEMQALVAPIQSGQIMEKWVNTKQIIEKIQINHTQYESESFKEIWKKIQNPGKGQDNYHRNLKKLQEFAVSEALFDQILIQWKPIIIKTLQQKLVSVVD